MGRPPDDPALEDKLACLREADAYPDPTGTVDVAETHMSWVFLTERHVYKLKKPVRYPYLDFGTIDARHRDCEREVRLNRRLAGDVYLGVVPLSVTAEGRLRLHAPGKAVDWLVKMRRLPAERMLDRALAEGRAGAQRIAQAALVLGRFYRDAPPVEIAPSEYRRRFEDEVRGNCTELAAAGGPLPAAHVQTLTAWQLAFLRDRAGLFDARVRGERIIEAHGDLRPEHICLTAPPVVIDCLEFKRDFRLLDPADELAFLALECERLGHPGVGPQVLEVYRRVTGDAPPPALLAFYMSHRACVRARIALWHAADPGPRTPEAWYQRARRYLDMAQGYRAAAEAG